MLWDRKLGIQKFSLYGCLWKIEVQKSYVGIIFLQ